MLMKMQHLQAMRSKSGFRIAPNWPLIGKITMTSQFADMTLQFLFFLRLFCFPCQLQLMVQISGQTYDCFYKGLTRNVEIGDTPVCVLPNIWRLGQVRDTKFSMDVSNEILLDAAKLSRVTAFTVLELLRKNQHWRRGSRTKDSKKI